MLERTQEFLTKVELQGKLAEFRQALEDEIVKIEKSGQSSTILRNGHNVKGAGTDFWYRFSVEYVPTLPADTPCKLTIGKDQHDVTVVSFEDNYIVLASSKGLPESIGYARLENGATVLMERLIKRIETNAEKENALGDRMLGTPDPSEPAVYSQIAAYDDLFLPVGNTSSQNNSIVAALSNDITYIWGPPGTGKTTVIGQIIDELYKHNLSVLVVSHTNTAVDGAIGKAAETYDKQHPDAPIENYPILRIGTSKGLSERVTLKSHVAVLGKELYEKKTELEEKQVSYSRRLNEIRPILTKSKWIKTSQISQVELSITKISELEVTLKTAKEGYEVVATQLKQLTENHPECRRLTEYKEKLLEENAEYDKACHKIKSDEATLKQLLVRLEKAKDEIAKHDHFAQLKEMESKMLSESFLIAELDKAENAITTLLSKKQAISTTKSSLEMTIAQHQSKSAVGKLFSNKSASLAEAQLPEIIIQIKKLDGDLLVQRRTRETYSEQIANLRSLQLQITAVIPKETKEYWIEELRKIESHRTNISSGLPGMHSQAENLHASINDLSLKVASLASTQSEIMKLVRLSSDKKAAYQRLARQLDQLIYHCNKMIEDEFEICSQFYDCTRDTSLIEQFEVLNSIHEAVKSDLAEFDIFELEKEQEDIHTHMPRINREIAEIKQQLLGLEKQAILHAQIVGATLAKSYLSDTIHERKFDTVILDEASMASIPALWCTSYLADKSIVIVGDFLQLPPIVMSETVMSQKWLGKDIFYHSGMKERIKRSDMKPNNFIMLNDQFRMEEEIANIANMYYGEYGGLRPNIASESRQSDFSQFYAWYNGEKTKHCVHMIDTESLHAWVTGVPQGKRHSRLNCFSAAVDVDLAFNFIFKLLENLDPDTCKPIDEPLVLIIAPYKPHVARINQLLDLEYKARGFHENLNYIRAGTIHSFQGSEADIVIFDLVIDEPHYKANLFMPDKEINAGLEKMFNVAVTRAKFKLFIVGNFEYCQKRAKGNALGSLLNTLLVQQKLKKEDAKTLFPDLAYTRPNIYSGNRELTSQHIVCREETFNDLFLEDILNFKQRMIIYTPFITSDRLAALLPYFADATSAGKSITIVTKALKDRSNSDTTNYRKYESALIKLGVKVIHKKGMHEKLIFVDADAVWIGSLNALSFTGLTGEIMHRHKDKELVAEYVKLLGIESICEVAASDEQKQCPICGSEMIVGESDSGGIYWSCVNKDYNRNPEQQYPHDGILRCKCGSPYIFNMVNRPRWICPIDSKHYQYIREGDLKLEKMAALIITQKDRKAVDKYFAEQRKEREKEKTAKVVKRAKTNPKNKKLPTRENDNKKKQIEQMSLFK